MAKYSAIDIARWFVHRNLEDVYSVFGKYSASGLRNKTHMESPWLDATNGGQTFNSEITRDSITRYFKENYVQN